MAVGGILLLALCLCAVGFEVDDAVETYQSRQLLGSLVGLQECDDCDKITTDDVQHDASDNIYEIRLTESPVAEEYTSDDTYEIRLTESPVTEQYDARTSDAEPEVETTYVSLTTEESEPEYYVTEVGSEHEEVAEAASDSSEPPREQSGAELYPDVDESIQRCLHMCNTIIHLFHTMRVNEVKYLQYKFDTLEQMLRVYSQFSDLKDAPSDSCHPAIRIMDSIIYAANAIKQRYENHTDCSEFAYLYPTEGSPTSESRIAAEITSEGVEELIESVTRRIGNNMEDGSEVSETLIEPDAEEYEEQVAEEKVISETLPEPCPEPEEATEAPKEPCPGTDEYVEEIIAEEEEHHVYPPFVGSLRGIPGVHYPNYSEVPITSFSCADKKYIPGFYADLETGCQVFHMCYKHRRESFLCPTGTIFNQPILACDYWYSSNCSLSPIYYDVNEKSGICVKVEDESASEVPDVEDITLPPEELPEIDLDELAKFLPVKAKVVEFEKPLPKPVPVEPVAVDQVASDIFDKVVSTATGIISQARDVIGKLPEPQVEFKPVLIKDKLPGVVALKMKPVIKTAVKAKLPLAVKSKVVAGALKAVPVAAAVKVASKAVPIAAKAKVAAALPLKVAAKAVPVAAKAKVAAALPLKVAAKVVPVAVKAKAIPVAKVAVPIAKAVPKLAVKASIPLKTKFVASTKIVPVKAKIATSAAALPFKVKMMKSAPVVKGIVGASVLKPKLAAAAIPLVKAKMLKAAAISPLTKKALAVGYLKLLKAKKLALMG